MNAPDPIWTTVGLAAAFAPFVVVAVLGIWAVSTL